MPIHQKLHQRLVQKLILTPSLQQAIKLLPMTTLELAELLNQEMVENPMLEEVPTEEAAQTAEQDLRDVGAAIIGNINEDGYLVASASEIAALGNWDATLVERAIEHIQ